VIRVYRNRHWYGWFYDETWRANIEIIWPVDSRKVAAHIKKNHNTDYETDDDWSAKCVEILSPQGAETNLICLRHWSSNPKPGMRGNLAHEIFHATEHILSARSTRLTKDTTEPYAYLTESITRRCYELLDIRRKIK
jgi:hypothetical protein